MGLFFLFNRTYFKKEHVLQIPLEYFALDGQKAVISQQRNDEKAKIQNVSG